MREASRASGAGPRQLLLLPGHEVAGQLSAAAGLIEVREFAAISPNLRTLCG